MTEVKMEIPSMPNPTPVPVKEFKYPESSAKSSNQDFATKRKRLRFRNDSMDSNDSSEEEFKPTRKRRKLKPDAPKIKLMKKKKIVTATQTQIKTEPVNYCKEILINYQAKNYAECLKLIADFQKLPLSDPQYKGEGEIVQYKIIQAACWTSMNIKKNETSEVLHDVLEKDPKNSFALYGLGLHQYNNGYFEHCIESFGKAVEYNPTAAMKRAVEYKAMAKNLLDLIIEAKFHFAQDKLSKAFEVINAALLIASNNDNVARIIKEIRNELLASLVNRLEKEVESSLPDEFEATELLIKSNKLTKAQKLVEKFYDTSPKTARGAYLKGLSVYMAGSLKESMKYFTEALKIDAVFDKATEKLDKAEKFQTLLDKANIEMTCCRFEQALVTLTECLKVDETNVPINQVAHFQRAMALFNLGNSEGAFEDYKKFEDMKLIVGDVFDELMIKKQET